MVNEPHPFEEMATAPREMIARFVSRLEQKFELSEYYEAVKHTMNISYRHQGPGQDCMFCDAPIDGHFFEECIARTGGGIDHMYVKKKVLSKTEA